MFLLLSKRLTFQIYHCPLALLINFPLYLSVLSIFQFKRNNKIKPAMLSLFPRCSVSLYLYISVFFLLYILLLMPSSAQPSSKISLSTGPQHLFHISFSDFTLHASLPNSVLLVIISLLIALLCLPTKCFPYILNIVCSFLLDIIPAPECQYLQNKCTIMKQFT